MRWIQNYSADIQYWVDTDIPDIGEITVNPNQVFPTTDEQGIYLVNTLWYIYKTVFDLWWWWVWGITGAINIWAWIWIYKDVVNDTIQLKTLKEWNWVEIITDNDSITIWTIWEFETQRNMTDNSQEDIVIWNKTIDRCVKIDYTCETGTNYQEWEIKAIQNWTTVELNHEFSWNPDIISWFEIQWIMNWNDIKIRLVATSVWSPLKFRYKYNSIKLAV